MSTKGFTGGAGTGKTTSLLRELETHIVANPLVQWQRVLSLTFMHGSRHRLAERLAKSSVRRQFECKTLDSFAWDICRRWRSRLRTAIGLAPFDIATTDFDATCEAASWLLSSPFIAKWVAARYPIVILDEFQDCKPVRVSIVQHLHERVKMMIAADDFQNLTSTVESPGVAWLRGLGVSEELTINRRTTDSDLIAAAHALRSGLPLGSPVGTSFKLISAPSAAVAASFISQTLAPATGKETVLLSAARQGNSTWVDKIIELVTTKQYGVQKAGPVNIKWERTVDGIAKTTISALGIAEGSGRINATAILAMPRNPIATQLWHWVEHQRRVLGLTEFGPAEVHAQIERAKHRIRSFASTHQGGRRAMTIHQAKNREFPVVIILWPFQVIGDAGLSRRLLYNAITRAKRRAIVIVQDPEKKRLNAPPFA